MSALFGSHPGNFRLDEKSEPAAPAQASGPMSEERLQKIEGQFASDWNEIRAEIRRLRSPDQRTLAAYQQGLEDGRSAPAQPDILPDILVLLSWVRGLKTGEPIVIGEVDDMLKKQIPDLVAFAESEQAQPAQGDGTIAEIWQWMLDAAEEFERNADVAMILPLTDAVKVDAEIIARHYAAEGARVQELEAQRLKLAKALLKYGDHAPNTLWAIAESIVAS